MILLISHIGPGLVLITKLTVIEQGMSHRHKKLNYAAPKNAQKNPTSVKLCINSDSHRA